MTLQLRFGFIIPLFFSMSTWAADLVIKPNHPDQYTVVKNDTLWDISGRFLQHPSRWPELWSLNTQIKDPYLIYPGDTLHFTTINGKPQLSLSRNPLRQRITSDTCILKEADFKNGRKDFVIGKDGKLKPCIRESEIEQPIRLIPYYQIAKYLSSPKVLGANELNQEPYIVDVLGEHILAGTGDRIFVRSIMQPDNTSYMIYRAGATLKDADTKELLGYEAIHVGGATLLELGDPATLVVDDITSSAIRIGDRIMPRVDDEVNFNFFARPPEQPITGSIISVLDGVTQIGINDVVVIDRGRLDGLLPGHELNIYRDVGTVRDPFSGVTNDTVQLPHQLAGMLMVFRAFDRVSYALVMQASSALRIKDRVQTPE